MRRLFMVAAVAAALAVPVSVVSAGIVGVGTAGANSTVVKCSGIKVTGPLIAGTLTFSKCKPAAPGKGYKTATASTAVLQLGGGNITWHNSEIGD